MLTRINLHPPVDTGVRCRNCGEPLVAVAQLRDREYDTDWAWYFDWRHRNGLKHQCVVIMPAVPQDYIAGSQAAKVKMRERYPDCTAQSPPCAECIAGRGHA